MNDAVAKLLERLPNVKRSGAGWAARCPAHDDKAPSLSIAEGDNGGAVVNCHAGCAPEAIVAAVGLTLADLFAQPAIVAQVHIHSNGSARPTKVRFPLVDPVTGDVLAYHWRHDYPNRPKDFRWQLPDGRWTLDERPVASLPLYRAHELVDAAPGSTVVVCEGEKATDAAIALGLVAVGTVCGAPAVPELAVFAPLAGHDVVLWPDNDENGRKQMAGVAARLAQLGIEARVAAWTEAPPKGDAADFREMGGTPAAAAALVAAAVPFDQAPAPAARFPLLTPAQVKRRPPPEFLVDGLLVRNTLAMLYAPPASFKSFLALGIALDVAAGRETLGRHVHAGSVLYISAEGSAGLSQRIRAWEVANGTTAPESCYFLLEQPQVLDHEQLAELAASIAALPEPPVLILIDTLARVVVGAEENSNKDMGLAIAAVDRLRRQTGACIWLIHHCGRNGAGPRGASAFDGALETIIEMKREGDVVALHCTKQKDAQDFAPIFLERRVISLVDQGAIGDSSMVLVPSERQIAILTGVAQQIASTLWETFGEDGATDSTWRKVCAAVADRSFYRAKRELLDTGYVASTNPGARGARFRCTVKYLEASGEYSEVTQ